MEHYAQRTFCQPYLNDIQLRHIQNCKPKITLKLLAIQSKLPRSKRLPSAKMKTKAEKFGTKNSHIRFDSSHTN